MDLTELPPTITVEEAGTILGLSRSSAYRAAARGQLPTIRFGQRMRVPTPRLLALLGIDRAVPAPAAGGRGEVLVSPDAPIAVGSQGLRADGDLLEQRIATSSIIVGVEP